MKTGYLNEVREHAINGLRDGLGLDVTGADLHHHLFNTDHFIIGTYQAGQWLDENVGALQAIAAIQTYERDNFGEVYTDFGNAEAVCNMFTYIAGEHLLNESDTLRAFWDERLTENNIDDIVSELENVTLSQIESNF